MANILPSKHIFLITVISVLIIILLVAFPEKKKQSNQTISIEAKPQPLSPSDTSSQKVNKQDHKSLSYEKDANTLDSTTTTISPILHTVEIASGDSLSTLLSKYKVSAQDIYKVSLADKKNGDLVRMRPGQKISFQTDPKSGQLHQLSLVQNQLESVKFTRENDTFHRHKISKKPDIIHTYKEATINNSLFVDGMLADIDESLLINMANIFGWDIDFALDLRKGDRFSILYEDKLLDGQRIGHGNILAAQFINNGRVYQALRYKSKKGAHYYTPDGLAMRKAFLRTPVDFTRISSVFNPNRLHPIFKTSRPHRGVDYAAASGTPVKAAGDGRIAFAGKQRGYGNVVIIDHGKGYQTLYAHLKGFARNIKRGKYTKQGNIIAYVGQTGWATGAHLHYEFRINGVHKNPVTVKLPNDDPMPKSDLKRYLPYAQKMVATLASSHSPAFSEQLALLEE
ncbi:Murein DD-endopeptidase MepM [Marinomonas spartinae]|uniref:Murein DD-endopeptidase MepM n=1 Tax=Marinomonas spartinae TaxID=1792290 RepID=A0A1A8TJK0_9GAMM|nr:peptidoglycan DD-metalloendopeptidase family protein [Marinomonas spartinae]SBS33030.1 Murein DD-endopeptidase MepM [Marinomonas spartinae]